MAFIIKLKGTHFNNSALPKLSRDKSINPGSITLIDFGSAYTYGGTIPADGTSQPSGTAYANLVDGGQSASVLGYGGNSKALSTYGGKGLKFDTASTKLLLGTNTKFVPAAVNEYLWIYWAKILTYTASSGTFGGLGDGQANNSAAGAYAQYATTFNSPAEAPAAVGTLVQVAQYFKWDGTSNGVKKTWKNTTAYAAPNQAALSGALPVPTWDQGTMNAVGSYTGQNMVWVLYRVQLINLQLAPTLVADDIVRADYLQNYSRF